jgi:hypothetical protein
MNLKNEKTNSITMKKIKDLEPFEIEERCFREWVEKDFKTLSVYDKNGGDLFHKIGVFRFVPRYAKIERKVNFEMGEMGWFGLILKYAVSLIWLAPVIISFFVGFYIFSDWMFDFSYGDEGVLEWVLYLHIVGLYTFFLFRNFLAKKPVDRLTTRELVRRIAELEIELRYHSKVSGDVTKYIKDQVKDLKKKHYYLP